MRTQLAPGSDGEDEEEDEDEFGMAEDEAGGLWDDEASSRQPEAAEAHAAAVLRALLLDQPLPTRQTTTSTSK